MKAGLVSSLNGRGSTDKEQYTRLLWQVLQAPHKKQAEGCQRGIQHALAWYKPPATITYLLLVPDDMNIGQILLKCRHADNRPWFLGSTQHVGVLGRLDSQVQHAELYIHAGQ